MKTKRISPKPIPGDESVRSPHARPTASQFPWHNRRVPRRVAAILDCFWNGQANEYLSRGKDEQEGHIFAEMLLVRQWLKKGKRNTLT